MSRRFKIFFIIILILLLSAGAVFYFGKGRLEKIGITFDDREKIQIIYTANLQGSILDLPCNKAGSNIQFYTIPQVTQEVDKIRESLEKKGVSPIIIDGGNTLFGVDDLSLSMDGNPTFRLLKSSGYMAMTAGRAEFLMGTRWMMKKKGEVRIFSGNSIHVKEYHETELPLESQFKGNFSRSFSTGVNGRKISFFSYFELEESPFLPGVKEEYIKADFDPSIDNLNRQIEKEGGDINIVLARVNNIREFAEKLRGADVVIPGRYHDSLPPGKTTKINGINVLPFINSRYMGVACIGISKKKDNNVDVKISFIKPESNGEKKIAGLKLYLDKFYKKYGKNYDRVHTAFLGYGNEGLKHTTGDPRETPTAYVIADMIRNYSSADVVLINLFSIRKPLSGIIRGEYVEWIMPFENKLVTMDLTGSQIEEIMKLNLRRDTKFMVMSGGQIKYGPGKKITLYIDGKPIDRKKIYRVATNDYLARSEKIEYRVFKMGKNVHYTEIPLNGIFLEALLRRRYIGMPPERVGIKTREEIEGIKNDREFKSEALYRGYFDLYYGRISKKKDVEKRINKDDRITLSGVLIYCGLTGRAFRESEGSDYYGIISAYDINDFEGTSLLFFEEVTTIFKASAMYRVGKIREAKRIFKRLSEVHPTDIRLRRLAEAVAGSGEKVAQKPPIWAKFKGDVRNTGRSPYTGPHSKEVSVLWKYKTYHSIKSSPAVAEDGTIYIGGGDGNFYALFPDGKLKWKYTLGGYILSSPAIGKDGTIYVGSGSPDSGSRRRTFTNSTRRVGRHAVTQKEGGSEKTGFFNAFNPDGTVKWRKKTGGWVASSPLVTPGGDVIVGCNDGYVYRFTSDGEIKWKFRTGSKVFSSPALGDDGTVYIGSGDFCFYAIDSAGNEKWKFRAENKFFSSAAVADDGMIYVGNDDSYLYAFKP